MRCRRYRRVQQRQEPTEGGRLVLPCSAPSAIHAINDHGPRQNHRRRPLNRIGRRVCADADGMTTRPVRSDREMLVSVRSMRCLVYSSTSYLHAQYCVFDSGQRSPIVACKYSQVSSGGVSPPFRMSLQKPGGFGVQHRTPFRRGCWVSTRLRMPISDIDECNPEIQCT